MSERARFSEFPGNPPKHAIVFLYVPGKLFLKVQLAIGRNAIGPKIRADYAANIQLKTFWVVIVQLVIVLQ